MFNIGPAELLVVLVIALLVLGPTKLPDAARQVGRALGEMRKLSSGFQAEMRDALKEPVEGKPTKASAKPEAGATGGSLSAPRPPAGDTPGEGAAVIEAEPAAGEGPAAAAPDAVVAAAVATDGDGAETPPPLASTADDATTADDPTTVNGSVPDGSVPDGVVKPGRSPQPEPGAPGSPAN